MNEVFGIILVFVAVIAIAAVLFGVWLVVLVLRMLGRGLMWMMGGSGRPRLGGARCPRGGCRVVNPPSAHFCRRCGQELPGRALSHRQAALW